MAFVVEFLGGAWAGFRLAILVVFNLQGQTVHMELMNSVVTAEEVKVT